MSRLLSAALVLLVPAVAVAAPPAVTAVAYHSEGKAVAFGTPGAVHVFDAQTGAPVGKSIAVAGRVTALAFDPRGHWLAIAFGDAGKSGLVRLHSLGAGKAEVEINAHRDAIYALCFSPDGKQLATAGYD